MHNQEENEAAVTTVTSNKISKERGKTMKNEKTSLNIRKLKKQVKGITLIALVVTIIVLLILAAVAINLTIGNNGIFTRAQNATQKWEEASKNEQDEMDKVSNFLDEYMNGNGGSQDGGNQSQVEGVTIPKGFYYVGGTKNDGIVISDAKADENKYSKENHSDQANIPADGLVGNQFVWVPVENIEEFKRYPDYYDGATDPDYFADCSEPAPEGSRYSNEVEEYNAMKASVEKNKGFYVARFEAGNENGKVVSKKGATVWNNIPWGTSMTEIGTEGAVAKAKGMYTDKSTYGVTSTLIYGTQWDAIMAWIDPAYKTSSCDTSSSYVANSTGKGNYTGEIATCGSSDNYRVKNIYDLAGNVREWTMEAYSANGRVNRGGGYSYSGSVPPASARSGNGPDGSHSDLRFPFSFVFVTLNAKAAVYVEVTQTSEKALSLNIEKKELNDFRR